MQRTHPWSAELLCVCFWIIVVYFPEKEKRNITKYDELCFFIFTLKQSV